MPTINEIAQRAGVSVSTVSRALNNKKGVGRKMRGKIISIADEINYFPHSSARALVQKRIGVIGVVIPRTSEFAFQNPFYPKMLMGISSTAQMHDYNLMLDINKKEGYVSLYYRKLVDGIIVIGNRIHASYMKELNENKIPSVVVPGYPAGSCYTIPSVAPDTFKSVQRVVSYLIKLGHRKIAFILGKMTSMFSIERFAAYKAAFEENNLTYDPKYLLESNFSQKDGFRLMGDLLDFSDPPTSVICINDNVTPGVMQQIKKRGLNIPEDISVVAIGSSDVLDSFEPPLTCIKTPVVEVGQTAAKTLIQLIETGHCAKRHTGIPAELIIRDSTGACSREKASLN
ncbi:substrate-binding domain-containing protein [Desulfotignum balticum]|uniref:substrate-binding domain-containing protein n=1 Tax=Desulfotignum balticum TaxID=115781 RepID=UPI0003F74970